MGTRQKSANRASATNPGVLPDHPQPSNLTPEALFLIPFFTIRLLINDDILVVGYHDALHSSMNQTFRSLKYGEKQH